MRLRQPLVSKSLYFEALAAFFLTSFLFLVNNLRISIFRFSLPHERIEMLWTLSKQ
jgi:hypothetical protein